MLLWSPWGSWFGNLASAGSAPGPAGCSHSQTATADLQIILSLPPRVGFLKWTLIWPMYILVGLQIDLLGQQCHGVLQLFLRFPHL